jgi:ATP-dependent RNA helicase DDX3X
MPCEWTPCEWTPQHYVHFADHSCRRAFRTGRAPILVATGISARGWDIKDVKHIINYDLPSGMHGGITEYVHRIGRTARIGHEGLATSFYNDRNEDLAQELVNILVECECDVPEFLSHLKPEEGTHPEFQDDTDDEAEGGDKANGDAGAGFGRGDEGGAPVANAWCVDTDAADTGLQADIGFQADGGAGRADAGW